MITWEQQSYAEHGNAGGVHLFTISWKIVRSEPDWVLKTTLPGYTKKSWKSNDKDKLKSTAEQMLSYWISKVSSGS
jgi:hypothetical protein